MRLMVVPLKFEYLKFQVWMSGSTGWGLVTDKPNGWTKRDGDVVCRSLGYKR